MWCQGIRLMAHRGMFHASTPYTPDSINESGLLLLFCPTIWIAFSGHIGHFSNQNGEFSNQIRHFSKHACHVWNGSEQFPNEKVSSTLHSRLSEKVRVRCANVSVPNEVVKWIQFIERPYVSTYSSSPVAFKWFKTLDFSPILPQRQDLIFWPN